MSFIFSCGDVNGIGLEIFYKYFNDNQCINEKIAIACNKKTLIEYFEKLSLKYKINHDELIINDNKINIIECENYSKIEFGKVKKDAGLLAIESIDMASKLVQENIYDFIITLPIQKETMYLADWEFTGHTEYFNKYYKESTTQMVLFSDNLRVVPLTIHIPLKDVSRSISIDSILSNIIEFNNSLRLNFGIKSPRIAVLGLNPHAGENGSIGDEEINIIGPAVKMGKENGIDVDGPFPADGFFGFGDFRNYDGVLSMFHDQGLIPLKLFAEGGGVNFTSGLSIIRTSPDHGTAMKIAGKNIASYKSLSQSIEYGIKIKNNRLKDGSK